MTTAEFVRYLDARGLDPRENGPGRWMSRCPAHEDKWASLSVRETDGDGRTLLNCFAGCEARDIVDELGLKLADLFPERLNGGPLPPRVKPEPPPLRGADLVLDQIRADSDATYAQTAVGVWRATCPDCGHFALSIIEDSGHDRLDEPWPPVTVTCWAGCKINSIKEN